MHKNKKNVEKTLQIVKKCVSLQQNFYFC